MEKISKFIPKERNSSEIVRAKLCEVLD